MHKKLRTDNNTHSLARTIQTTTMLTAATLSCHQAIAQQSGQKHLLEEVIITAQKREQSLQNAPIAISVLSQYQLTAQGITSLDALGDGAIPSLRVQPFANTPSTLNIAIRGNGPTDVGQITREYPVAIYLDGIYLGRAQGLGMDLADLERIEVLRGPQSTLFGRNATGGAINVISRKPTGEFGIKQVLGSGRFNEFRSATHINLPEFAGISAKIDYLHTERDGWVKNTSPGAADYNAYDKNSTRVSLHWQASKNVTLDYVYDRTDIDATQNYLQMYDDSVIGLIGAEHDRETTTRFPVALLEPTVTAQNAHALTAIWEISDHLTVKSLSAYRELEEDVNNNYAGVFYFNGLVFQEDISQEQFSQEFQLIGTHTNLEWVAGLYYFEEEAQDEQQNIFTLDSFGCLTGTPLSPIAPTNVFTTCAPDGTVASSFPLPPTLVDADSDSYAVYAQATLIPEAYDEKLSFTVGMRYTEDEKSGSRQQFAFNTFEEDWGHFDYAITLDYKWTDNLSTYIKRSTAYRAGGVSLRATSFSPYDEEEVRTKELGLKSELWGRRLRINAALFETDYKNMQIDFADPTNIAIVETINATRKVSVDGAEIDLTLTPTAALTLGVHYTYLDGDMPLQPNPLGGGTLTAFKLTQTPKHAGALTLDYHFAPLPWGTMTAHVDATSTDHYAYLPVGFQRFDAYTLFNARLTLAQIKFGQYENALKVSVWGKNITDEEYITYATPVGSPPVSITQVFGTPRTLGVDLTFEM